MKYTYPSFLCHVGSEYLWLWGALCWSISKNQELLLEHSCTFRKETPFRNEIYLSNSAGSCRLRIYLLLQVYLQRARIYCLGIPTFKRETPFTNQKYLSNFTSSSRFRICMVMYVYLQKARSYCFGTPTPSGVRRPLKVICLFKVPGSFKFIIFLYMIIWVYLQRARNYCLVIPAPSGGRRPLQIKYIYPSSLGHVDSENIRVYRSISKGLEVIAW